MTDTRYAEILADSGNRWADYVDLKTVPDVAIYVFLYPEGVFEIRQCRLSTRRISQSFLYNNEDAAVCYRDLAARAKAA